MEVKNPEEVKAAVLSTLRRGMRSFERRMALEHLSGPTSPTSLAVRTGALRRSLQTSVVELSDTRMRAQAMIGLGLPYAHIHEKGGTITPKKAQYLAIPLERGSKTAFGPRSYPGKLVAIRSKGGNLILAEILQRTRRAYGKKISTPGGTFTQTYDSQIKPVYVLKKQVGLPPRLSFQRTFQSEAQNTLNEVRETVRRVTIRE